MIYLLIDLLDYIDGPQWPSGSVSALGPEVSRFEIRIRLAWGPPHAKSYVVTNALPLVLRGSLERLCHPRCRPRYLNVVQNYEFRPK
ncbi:hypothetical protein AVEN_256388-1 [Araneus ventricosus]|uniref:Uncharacterized protein n=1 Tax=Araneus ventricosus TaxID=182803 RepID=A0A4Y2FFN7_ARAVE|nr:hypothetical protein AVEN_256388-1 [Araneus ventricosus]